MNHRSHQNDNPADGHPADGDHADGDRADATRDALDEQIRVVLRVEPSPRQLARLESFWQLRSRAERRRRRLRRVWAMAATVLVAATATLWLGYLQPGDAPIEAQRTPQAEPTPPDPKPEAKPERNVESKLDDNPQPQPFPPAGREPTTYERFQFILARTARPPTARPPSPAAAIDELIQWATADPAADPKQLVEASGRSPLEAERLLLRRLPRAAEDQKHAIVRLLAACGTGNSVPQLLRLAQRQAFRGEALQAIEGIVGVEQLAGVVWQTRDRGLRAGLIGRMLTSGSLPALRSYLSLVGDDATRGEALVVADASRDLPLAALLGLLQDEEEPVRVAAAIVLGHVNGPEVTQSLIAMVIQQQSAPEEAWIALMACRGEQAQQFFAYATRDPYLLGHVNRARVWWARAVP